MKFGLSRRGLLAALTTWLPGRTLVGGAEAMPRVAAPAPAVAPDREGLIALARVVLPAEIGAGGQAIAVDAFLDWLRGYRPDAEMDHGYGSTRLRHTAPDPAPGYTDDLAALDSVAREHWGVGLTGLDEAQLGELVARVIDETAPDLDDLPGRPDDTHVIIALMAHYFRSPIATDRCYGLKIGRETCRGLLIDVDGLEPLAGD